MEEINWGKNLSLKRVLKKHKGFYALEVHKKNGFIDKILFDINDLDTILNKPWNTSAITNRNKTKYAVYKGSSYTMHKLLMGEKNGYQIDHINGNGLDNRRRNLRFVTPSQNCQNRNGFNKRGLPRGIQLRKFKNGRECYRVRIRRNGTLYNIGHYDTIKEANEAYNAKAKELYGDGVSLNGKA